jgi:hypothetical protein
MEIKTESSVDDVYFGRTIINFTVKLNSGEMSKIDEVKKELEKENSQGKLIIYTIKSVYGKNEARGIAHIYKDAKMPKKYCQSTCWKRTV